MQNISVERRVTSQHDDDVSSNNNVCVLRSSGGGAIFHCDSDAPAPKAASRFVLNNNSPEAEAAKTAEENKDKKTKSSRKTDQLRGSRTKLRATVGRPEMASKVSPTSERGAIFGSDDVSLDDEETASSAYREDVNGFDVDVDDVIDGEEEDSPLLLAAEVVTQILDDVITRAVQVQRRKEASAPQHDVMVRLASLQ